MKTIFVSIVLFVMFCIAMVFGDLLVACGYWWLFGLMVVIPLVSLWYANVSGVFNGFYKWLEDMENGISD